MIFNNNCRVTLQTICVHELIDISNYDMSYNKELVVTHNILAIRLLKMKEIQSKKSILKTVSEAAKQNKIHTMKSKIIKL